MKKFENLGRKLSKNEQRKVSGGNPPEGGGGGSCTYTNGGVQCSSTSGNCQWLYCSSQSQVVVGVCCDGVQHKNHGYNCPDACCDA